MQFKKPSTLNNDSWVGSVKISQERLTNCINQQTTEIMELTQSYKNKAAINSPRISLRQTVLTFINKNADVFEALTRSAYPFGGNGLPLNRYATNRASVRNADDSITRVQQQVDELTRVVNRLNNQINAIQPAESPVGSMPNQSVGVDRSAALSNEIGINRFRALQAKPQGNR